METLIDLHQARWAAGGGPGVSCDADILAFHRATSPGLLAAGLPRLAVLRVDSTVAAAILALLGPGRIALLGPGRIFSHISGYDTAQSFVSPGTLLGAMLEEAVAEGRAEAHFLRGREAYKYAWGAPWTE